MPAGNIDGQLRKIESARVNADNMATAAKNTAADLQDVIDSLPEDVDLEQDVNDVNRASKMRFCFEAIPLKVFYLPA